MVTLHRNHRAISAPLGIGERDLAPMEALAFKYGGTDHALRPAPYASVLYRRR
jgi:hypothetical protein